jgi:6-phosphofructokinase
MNAAIRGAVRCALDRGATIYGVCEGYDGLVQVLIFSTPRIINNIQYFVILK